MKIKCTLIFFIHLISMHALQAQTSAMDKSKWIWRTANIWTENGSGGDSLWPESYNIELLPENVKALIAYFATLHEGRENKKLVEALGFPTLKKANQILSEKWIANKDTLEKIQVGYPRNLALIRWDNKIFFWSGIFYEPSVARLFEENDDGKMIFKQQFFNVRLNRDETPEEMLARLYSEANFEPDK